MNQTADYQIFVASSLNLIEQRKAVKEAINEYNTKNKNNEGPSDTFKVFLYEKSDICQQLDKEDAQNKINLELKNSPIFFLIIEHNVKPLTDYEFELAKERFDKNEMPRFIYIFLRSPNLTVKEEWKDNLKDALTYEDFTRKHNLKTCRVDINGDLVTHSKVYEIPFTNTEDLKNKILDQLNRLPGKLPPTGSKKGWQLEKEDFYSDVLRREGSPEAFYHRDIDDKLLDKIKNSKMVLVTGPSLCGKTRSVMEALKKIEDGWVYTIGDRNDGLAEELKMLRKYMVLNDHVKLYIEIDNLDQHVAMPNVREDLYNLINAVMSEGCEGMIVATASNYMAVKDHLALKNYGNRFTHIDIPPLSETEFRNAVKWFKLSGVENIVVNNLGYQQLGALFVDLTRVKSLYSDFLTQDTVERTALLKAIKAQSIWRSDAFGNIELLKSMTTFFAGKKDFRLFSKAMAALRAGGQMGVTNGESRLNIEEYVYQYIIGYDGNLIEAEEYTDSNGDLIDLEQELILDILNYCIDQRENNPKSMVGSESLTRQVSRIIRRCDHQKEVTQWLYEMWSGTEGDGLAKNEMWSGKDDDELAKYLQDDRKKCEENSTSGEEKHYYSSIVRKYIETIRDDGSDCNMKAMEARINAYDLVPKELRVDELFGALMRTAKTADEREQILKHADHNRFGKMPDTILAEMEWAKDYKTGRNLLNKVTSPCDNVSETNLAQRMLDTANKPYDLFLYGRMLRRLATLTSDDSEFDDLCSLLRKNFICLIYDQRLLEQIKDNEISIEKDSLTIIDLMGALGLWVASQCAISAFGDDIQSCEALEKMLLESVQETLDGNLTNELQTRMVVSAICSRLIKNIAEETDYDDVYKYLFTPLVVEHPLYNGHSIIFRNTYTYTAMMSCRNANVRNIMNLFSNDLRPHVEDKSNLLSVNRFTVNTMLNMCKGEGKIYPEQVNSLYDMLKMKRDLFAYNKLIEFATDLKTVEEILNEMNKESVTPNLFTYLYIQRNNEVDFNTALWFLYDNSFSTTNINKPKPNKSVEKMLPNKETLARMRKEVYNFSSQELDAVKDALLTENGTVNKKTIQQMLQLIKPAWLNLFEKRLRSDDDRKAIHKCLEYLRTNHPEMLMDGTIYNVVLKNNSFFENFKETIEYITKALEPKGFVPDTYTADSLLNNVLSLRGADRRDASRMLNEFIEAHPKCLSNEIIVQRIKLFRNQTDSLEFVFINNNGGADKNNYTPISYLERMVKLGIPIDSFAIYNFMRIKEGNNQSTCEKLAKLLSEQTYEPEAKDIRTVREMFSPYGVKPPNNYVHDTPMTRNKDTAWNFKKYLDSLPLKKIDPQTVKEKVTEALMALDWKNSYSALCSLNDILDKYVSRMRDKMNGEIWKDIKEYYEKYVTDNKDCVGPSSFTLNLLAKSLTTQNTVDGRKWLLMELQKHAKQVNIQPHMLGELARIAGSVEDLIKLTRAVVNLGCKPNEKTADTYVFYLNTSLLNKDKPNAGPILSDLLNYTFNSEERQNYSLLEKNGRTDLHLGYYKDPRNISEDLLHSLLFYNYNTKKYDSSYIADRILTICPDSTIAALMNRLVNGKDKQLAKEYIPPLFNKQRDYSTEVLLFLTSTELLPSFGYNNLLEKFYTYECKLPEQVISILLEYLDPAEDNATMACLINIYINITHNRLRQGDMLIKKAPKEYAAWCHRALDCIDIQKFLKDSEISIYPKLVNLFLKKGNIDLSPQHTNTNYQALRRAEKRYTDCVSKGEISLTELYNLPDLWYKLRWRPSEQLILSIIRAYSDNPQESYEKISSISNAISNAIKKKLPQKTKSSTKVKVRYNSLGSFPPENGFYFEVDINKLKEAIPHPFIVDLCKRISGATVNNKQTQSHEKDFIQQLRNGNISACIIDSIPTLLSRSKLNITQELAETLTNIYKGKGYLDLIRYVLDNKLDAQYMIVALMKAEERFATKLQDNQTSAYKTLQLINGLPDLWQKLHTSTSIKWLPGEYVALAIVSFLAQIPNKTSKQIALIANDLDEAHKKHSNITFVHFNSLGNPCNDSSLFIKVRTKDLRAAMPHPYIIRLCLRTLNDSTVDTSPQKTKKHEYDYLKQINNGEINVDKRQLKILSMLWKMAKWRKADEWDLIIRNLDDYKRQPLS